MIINTFSKRLARQKKGNEPDVYRYDDLPTPFRVQLNHILRDAIGEYKCDDYDNDLHPIANPTWRFIHDALARELGLFQLAKGRNAHQKCCAFIMDAPSDHVLDLLEIAFRMIDLSTRGLGEYEQSENGVKMNADDAITELNHRFAEHALGYEFADGSLMRKDNEYLHREVVKEAIGLLTDERFKGASSEFLQAHTYFRELKHKDAIQNALKAFESTLQTICARMKWRVGRNATAKSLLDCVFTNGLLPTYLQTHLGAVRTSLEAGLPTVRNRTSGHGQGEENTEVPDYIAAYALHLCATNIVLLVGAFQAAKSRKGVMRSARSKQANVT